MPPDFQTTQNALGIASLSIVIPAFNEEERLPPTLKRIVSFLASQNLSFTEILVVNDGSSDGTADQVRALAARHPEIHLLENPRNRGKGYSVRHGVLAAHADWILITDADLSTPIEEAIKLTSAARNGGFSIAIGSRAIDRSLIGVRQQPLREWSGRIFNLSMRAATGLPYRDTQCGFKLYRADAAWQVFTRQRLNGFSYDVENLCTAKARGLAAVEVPVRWNNAEGTKVGGLSGLKSFADLIRIRRLPPAPEIERLGEVYAGAELYRGGEPV